MTTLPLQKSSTTGWWTQDPLLERTIVPFRMLEDTMMDPFRRERMLPFENMMMRPFDNNTHNRTLGTLTNVFKTDVVEHPTAFCLQAGNGLVNE